MNRTYLRGDMYYADLGRGIGSENGLELPSLVLLEQLRTIDKKRLGAYIGRLEEKHI